MTLAELDALTRRELDDEVGADAARLVSASQMSFYINDAVNEACIRSRLLIDSTTTGICTVPVVAGTVLYAVDPRVIAIMRGKLTGTTSPLKRVSYLLLDEQYEGWEDKTGTPEAFVTGMQSRYIKLFPAPTAAATLNLTVARLPLADLVNDDDVPEIQASLHQSLIQWVKYRFYGNHDAETYDQVRANHCLTVFTAKFGPRTAQLFDLFDAMHIPQYTPEAVGGNSLYSSTYF